MSFIAATRSLAVVLGLLVAWNGVLAQSDLIPKGNFGFGGDGEEDDGPKITFKASYDLKKGTKEGTLKLTATLAEGWHVYSVTQKKPLLKTQIKVTPNALAEPTAPEAFKPDKPAKVHREEKLYGDLPLEEHEGSVTWSAPVRLADDADPEKTKLAITISGQVCSKSCIPFSERATAKFAGYVDDVEPPKSAATNPAIPKGDFGLGGDEASGDEIQFFSKYEYVKDLKKAKLSVTVMLGEGWWTYAPTQPKKDGLGPMATTIVVKSDALADPQVLADPKKSALLFQPTKPFKSEIEKEIRVWEGLELQKHLGGATWTAMIDLAEEVDPAKATFDVAIRGQRCDVGKCIPYNENLKLAFDGYTSAARSVEPPSPGPRVSDPLESPVESAAQPSPASAVADPVPPPAVKVIGQERLPFWQAALFAIIGGLILNVMPCVLPVIGLKIIAFAEQAGHSRSKVLALNLWYCAGMLAVFLVLATLAAFLNIGWSDQFKSPTFRYIMLGGVFVMGLSFLGVWEIPIPGFASSDHSQKLQQQEGVAGAFSKGVFTTILATPCSGPFLGGVFFYTVSAPWYETYAIFSCIGLGMALPYLIVGAEPSLIKWLPKPGAWMDTFKQTMGFVMLGTAIYLFQTVQNPGNVLAVLIMLLGLGVACWWIGRVPSYAETQQKLLGWAGGIAMAAAIAWGGFQYFASPSQKMIGAEPGRAETYEARLFTWKPYSPDALAQAQAEGKTVMIDFTAEWCPNCHWNMEFVIDTEPVKEAVEKNEVVAMIADWTDGDEAVTAKLKELKSKTIPFLAIYPAARPGEVIGLRDVLSQSQLLKALEEAGPSKTVTAKRDKPAETAQASAK
jgi:thiol:disulfide interchange protein